MNKNDCINLGYILSQFVAREIEQEEFIDKICDLDSRIPEEFALFGDCRERDEAVMERYKFLIVEELGPNWCMSKACTKELSKRVWAQAEKEITL